VIDVDMKLVAFKPETVRIAVGQTVRWTQHDPGAHTATSGTVEQQPGGVKASADGTFDSGNIAQNATFERTFDSAGTFAYFCRIHPATMRGVIEVA
jgi:plastocyanin